MFLPKFMMLSATLLASASAIIMVSKSPLKTDSVPLVEASCLSGVVYIYVDVLESDDVQKVTWFTKKSVCDTERFNKKTERTFPFDFKGGNRNQPMPWETSKVKDAEYVMYANLYDSTGTIAERFREYFTVCNDETLAPTMAPTAAPIGSNAPTFVQLFTSSPTRKNVKCDRSGGNDYSDDDENDDETMSPTMAPTSSPTMAPTSDVTSAPVSA